MNTLGPCASRRRLSTRGAGLALALASGLAQAALTDISSTPLASSNAAQVKPNIMLLMDTSGSMGWGHMPDEVEDVANGRRGFYNIGYKSYQCNVLYYNPNNTYQLPRRSDGTFFPTPAFASAPDDAFDSSSSTVVDLSSAFKAYGGNSLRNTGYSDTAQAAYYYLHTGGSAGSGALAYNQSPCWDQDTAAPGTAGTYAASDGGTWTRKLVSATSGPGATDERANFAIWYTYYRTRIDMIKSAASLAFTPLTDSFRVGFITVNPKYPNNVPAANDAIDMPVNPAKYLPIADFDSAQRTLWFDKLFSQKPGGSSPAREGLARVGRHYAGQHDGINTGMPEDPVQYSCQQNFTIMTTDGYWNDQAESPGAGPVMIDGTTLVGQQDGTLTNAAGLTPRPIWDGIPDGQIVTTDKVASFAYAPCGNFFSTYTSQMTSGTSQVVQSTAQTLQSTTQQLQSTNQNLKSTVQNLQSTTQATQTTTQNQQSTNQNLKSTAQRLQSTTQVTQSTLQTRTATQQNLQSTTQNLQGTSGTLTVLTQYFESKQIALQSTAQNLRSTTQNLQSTTQPLQSTVQNLKSTTQNLKSTNQNLQSTAQTTQSTVQNRQSTAQNLKSTTQRLQTTSQSVQSTSQTTQSTSQIVTSASQLTIQTSQTRQSTSQLTRCDASTELCTPVPVGSCTPSGSITCETTTTGPTLVASCTPQSPSAGNNYITITCSTTSSTPVGTGSCTAQAASAANNYTTTTCNTVTTGSTPTASCNPAAASSANNYTATTCNTLTTGPTAVATCTPTAAAAGNNYTTTTCGSATTTNVPVASCTPSAATAGNNWTTTNCGTAGTTNVPVSSCTPSAPSAGNSWTTTTCGDNNTSNVPVASCVASAGTAGNSWVTTTCATNNTTNVPVATCTAAAASAGNNWTATTCPAPVTTGPTAVQTCTPVAASAGNNWTATTCGTNNTTNVAVATCTASAATAGNNWTTTTCPAPVVTTNVPASSCNAAAASAGNSWTTTTCSTNNTTNVPVATCTAAAPSAGNSWTTTTCPAPVTTGPTAVQTCTPVAAAAGNNWTATVCSTNQNLNVAVQTCTPGAASAGNNWTTTTCGTNNTSNVGVQTCTPATAAAGNAWTTTTCSTNNTSNVPVASCTAAAASAGNNWTTTTCPAPTIVEPPTAVQTCTPVAPTAGNGYTQTLCQTVVTSTPTQTCTPQAPSAANNWTATTCSNPTTANVPVQTCTPAAASAANGWVTTTCGTNNTTNVPVATCTASAATAGNNWTTTTCPAPITTGPTPSASCTPVAASAGNNWTATTCPNVSTGPTGVASCTPVAASAGNSWTATTCGSNNTANVPVQTCTASGPSAGNGWTTTTCTDNNTSNMPVATCTATAATAGNNWTTTTCPAPVVTTNVPVASCTAAAASAGNNWTTTTCPAPVVTGPTGVQTCTPAAASAGNNWTTTTCGSNNTSNVAVASCTPSAGNGGNSWVTTTCSTNNTTNVPVLSCTASAATAGNGWTTTTCPPALVTTNVPVVSCTAAAAQIGNNWTATTCTPNNTTNVAVASCTPSAASAGNNWTTTTCASNNTANMGVQTCTPSVASAANNWTTITCPAPIVTGPTPVGACSPAIATAANGWTATTCATNNSPVTIVQTCNPASANAGNIYTATICTPVGGKKISYTLTTTVSTTLTSAGVPVGNPVVTTSTDPAADLDGTCYAPNSEPALPSPNPQAAGITAGPTAPAPCTGWPCTVGSALNGARSINSLADVSQYYYVTDLRPGMIDNVPPIGSGPEDDRVRWQHMTTFSIALGVSGTLQYRPDYKSGAVITGDFADIRTGAKNWPLWPDPGLDTANDKSLWNDPRSIDDFWHTAVNGRGTYFSATNPTSVINGLGNALAGIQARLASGSAAGTSSLQPVPGDNFVYEAQYTTNTWTGDIQAHDLDTATGNISPTVNWSAQAMLDTKTGNACDNRNIYLIRPGATNNLVNFTSNTSVCDGSGMPTGAPNTGLNASEMANFGALNVSLMSQYPNMTDGTAGTADQRTPASGSNLVNYLRGERGLEDFTSNDASKLYRKREHVLGDIVDGQPVFVKAPFATYQDAGYGAFKSAQAGRTPMVYAPANDGMLHAFYAGTSAVDPLRGQEAWALIPTAVLPNLWKLADANYGANHQFFVDGTPTVGDAFDSSTSTWKTVLVAGLNDGGKSYYAVDVTNPTSPKVLWEFKWSSVCYDGTPGTAGADCHLGYTFGKPAITKLTDGTWVVIVTSGYNNVNSPSIAGDGQGYLYVLDAFSGRIRYKISTGVGDASTPSGLAQINNFIDNAAVSNTTTMVYGGDLLGHIWRFDVNDTIAPSGREATLIGVATDSSANPQPITTRPELAEFNGRPMIFTATGRLLGASDIADVQQQSIYGIVDLMTGDPVYANLRQSLVPLGMTQVGSGPSAIRTIACTGNAAECASMNGWVVDLPDSGERVNVDPKLVLGTVVVPSNVPQSSACSTGGYSWLNYLSFSTGQAVTTSPGLAVSQPATPSGQALTVGLTVVQLPDGTLRAILVTSDAAIRSTQVPFDTPPAKGKRISWREIAR